LLKEVSKPDREPRVVYDATVRVRKAAARQAPDDSDPSQQPWSSRLRDAKPTPPPKTRPASTSPLRNTWGAEWNRLLEHEGWTVELPSGKRLALEAAVRTPEIRAGVMEASVGVPGERPHRVQVRAPTATLAEWTRLVRQVVDDQKEATVTADLARGEIPMALVDAADRHRVAILPRRVSYLSAACTCGGAQLPCDHVLGLHLVVARRLYREPQLLLTFRGLDAGTLGETFERIRAEAAQPVESQTASTDPYAALPGPEPEWERLNRPPAPRPPLPAPDGWRAAESFDAMVRRIIAAARGHN
jgi:uncharacterized Zn finger protein